MAFRVVIRGAKMIELAQNHFCDDSRVLLPRGACLGKLAAASGSRARDSTRRGRSRFVGGMDSEAKRRCPGGIDTHHLMLINIFFAKATNGADFCLHRFNSNSARTTRGESMKRYSAKRIKETDFIRFACIALILLPREPRAENQ